MGEPAEVSAQDRAETLADAKRWLDAVREDRNIDLVATYGDTNGFVTALAQLATLLAEQLADVRAAKEEACDERAATDEDPCSNCGGTGFSHHNCGEDCCSCADPEDNVPCDWCSP